MPDPPVSLPLFIHSDVDDYGLTTAQFRLLCHIARRGHCWAAVKTISDVCRMDKKTVRDGLKFLSSKGIIGKQERRGGTTAYWVNPLSQWEQHPPVNKGQPPHPKDSRGTPTVKRVDHPTQKTVVKGSPSEGSPLKDKETGRLHAPRSPDGVMDVLKFALTNAAMEQKSVDAWATANEAYILNHPARLTIASQQNNDRAQDALARAFRFIYYNNRAGWCLDHTWRAAYPSFAENCDYGSGPADVPKDWTPHISTPQ